MGEAHRGHLDDLPPEQFDPPALDEDPGGDHLLVLMRRETAQLSGDCGTHGYPRRTARIRYRDDHSAGIVA